MATAVSGTSSNSSETARGFALALGAYLIWGLLPFYMKAVAHIPAAERDLSFLHIPETGNQTDQRGLSGAGGTNNGAGASLGYA